MSRVAPRPAYIPPPKVGAKKYNLNRRTRKGKSDDDLYNVLRDIYLELHPFCALCDLKSIEVHHICSGNAGKEASRLNQDTWLPVCRGCHSEIEAIPWRAQLGLKLELVSSTNRRLKT